MFDQCYFFKVAEKDCGKKEEMKDERERTGEKRELPEQGSLEGQHTMDSDQ